MAWFSRKPKAETETPATDVGEKPAARTGDWVYSMQAAAFQDVIGRRPRRVTVKLRVLKNRAQPEVSIYLDGRKAGYLNAKNSARFAPRILEREPESREVDAPGEISAMDGGRLYGLDVDCSHL